MLGKVLGKVPSLVLYGLLGGALDGVLGKVLGKVPSSVLDGVLGGVLERLALLIGDPPLWSFTTRQHPTDCHPQFYIAKTF